MPNNQRSSRRARRSKKSNPFSLVMRQGGTVKVLAAYSVTVTSTGGGTFAAVIFNTVASSALDWASLSGLYPSCRLLASRMRNLPIAGVSAALGSGLGCIAVTNDLTAPSAPAGITALQNADNDYRLVQYGTRWTMMWKPVFPQQRLFVTSASPPFTGGFQMYFSSLALASTVGLIQVEYVVEFARA